MMRTIARLALTLAALATLPHGALVTSALAQTTTPPAVDPALPTPATPAPASPAATTPATPPAAETLTGLAAWEHLKGNTIEGKAGGQTFSEFFDAAGGVKYVDKDGLSAGTWAVQNGKICFDFPEDDDRSCSTFEVSGATGKSKDDDGTVVKFDVVQGNPKGL